MNMIRDALQPLRSSISDIKCVLVADGTQSNRERVSAWYDE